MRTIQSVVIPYGSDSLWLSASRLTSPRVARFGLGLHPDKTRLIEFGRFAAQNRRGRGQGKPETFSFLGFTHICAQSQAGQFLLKRITDRKRLRSKLTEVRAELRRRMHAAVVEQGAWLRRVVQGHFNYYAVPTNIHALCAFRTQVTRSWTSVLRRRGQTDRTSWSRMDARSERWLPHARTLHPWPERRFDGMHPR